MNKSTLSHEYFGIGSLEKVRSILAVEKPRGIFLVRGRDSYRSSGAESKLTLSLQEYRVVSFADFSPNAKSSDIEKGIDLFRQHHADFVLAVGGGSALDLAKGIALLADQDERAEAYIVKRATPHSRTIPLLAVPTTAGTGSEATQFAVIYVGKTKYSLAHPSLLPDYAIIDPSLTFSLAAYPTACTGMDALAQAIESYWSVHSTEESQGYAREAIRLALAHLEAAVNRPTGESRVAMARAANLAGKAINISFTTACHAISYPFTSYFNVPHGHAVALTLPEMVMYNAEVSESDCGDPRGAGYVQRTLQELTALFGVSSLQKVKAHLEELMDALHLPRQLRYLGISQEDGIMTIIQKANPERMTNNPRTVTESNLQELLHRIY